MNSKLPKAVALALAVALGFGAAQSAPVNALIASSRPAVTSVLAGGLTPTASQTAGSTAPAASQASVTAAIQAVIEKANQEQSDAFAKNDPTLMKDTATSDYYNQLVQGNQDMVSGGVSAIKLVNLQWGDVTLNSSTSATATTTETWQTTFTDSSTDQSTDRNVYTLTFDGSAWKIQSDDHPDASQSTSPSQSTQPTTPTQPAQPTTPSQSTQPTTPARPGRTTQPSNPSVPAQSTAPSSSAPAATTAAVQTVIQKANQEQADAFAKNDPTLMKDTATSAYYDEITQINQQMATAGVSAIKLLNLQWGGVTLNSPTTATVTTTETWQATYTDGSTDQSTDQNVYTLVLQNGAWKIQSDDQPNSGQSVGGTAPSTSPSGTTAPSGITLPSGITIPSEVTVPSTSTSPSGSTRPSGRTDQSNNWSGYSATGGNFTSVTGTWTVPQSNGTAASGASAAWVGIGGVSSRDLIQAGTEENSDGSGHVRYSAWIEMLPKASEPVPFTVRPGDSVTVTITETSPASQQWQISFKNNTTGQTYQTTVQYASSNSSAEWIQEAPSGGRGVLPLDSFGSVAFSKGMATRDGKSMTISQLGGSPITLVSSSGTAAATPTALTSDGQGFTVTQSSTATGTSTSTTRPGRSRTGSSTGTGSGNPYTVVPSLGQ